MAGFFRYIFFCVFFAVGTGAIVLSLLVDEIEDYYRNKETLELSEAENVRLQKLNAEYDLELAQIEHDPNVIARLKRLTVGEHPNEEDTTFPIASAEDIAKADYVLKDTPKSAQKDDPFKKIVDRCLESQIRKSLFAAGAGLIIITFIFFGNGRTKAAPKQE